MRNIEVTAHRKNGRWVASEVERSGGGGNHGGDDDDNDDHGGATTTDPHTVLSASVGARRAARRAG